LELVELVPHVVTAVISVGGTAITLAFTLGRKASQAEAENRELTKELEGVKKELEEHLKADALEHEKIRERHLNYVREASDRWNEMLRTLGQIEGMLNPRENSPRATSPRLPRRG
jgi:hypothetical protein